MDDVKIVLFGGGGGAIQIARLIKDINATNSSGARVVVSDVVDEGVARVDDLSRVLGCAVTAHSDVNTVRDVAGKKFVVTLGHTPLRDEKFRALKQKGLKFHTVIHPSAQVPQSATIGSGSIVSPYALVGEFVNLGENVFVNVRATVGHDADIGDSAILSPHVAIGGSVCCGKSVFLGAGVIVNPGLEVGQHSKLSAGSVVRRNVPAGSFAFGNPAVAEKKFNPNSGRPFFAS